MAHGLPRGGPRSLFAADQVTPLKRKRFHDDDDPPTLAVDVVMPGAAEEKANETMTIEMKWPVKPQSLLAVHLDAEVLEFVVLFIRSFGTHRAPGRKSLGSQSQGSDAVTDEM